MKASMRYLRGLMIAGGLTLAVAGGTLYVGGNHSLALSWQPSSAAASPMVDPVFDQGIDLGDHDSRPPDHAAGWDDHDSRPPRDLLQFQASYLTPGDNFGGYYDIPPVAPNSQAFAVKIPLRLCAFGILHSVP